MIWDLGTTCRGPILEELHVVILGPILEELHVVIGAYSGGSGFVHVGAYSEVPDPFITVLHAQVCSVGGMFWRK